MQENLVTPDTVSINRTTLAFRAGMLIAAASIFGSPAMAFAETPSPTPSASETLTPTASPTPAEVVGVDDSGMLPSSTASKPPVVGVDDSGLLPKPVKSPGQHVEKPSLPRTGVPVVPLAVGGLLTIGAGATMIRVGRKRTT
ncbi:MAG: hypothetical protein QFB87_05425 [Patescibacteria group bacterium]|nr:hypothetical protein [Patescibacteria group bacterium]